MHIFFICPLISYCRFIYDVFWFFFYVFWGKSMDRFNHTVLKVKYYKKILKKSRSGKTLLLAGPNVWQDFFSICNSDEFEFINGSYHYKTILAFFEL